MKQRKKDAKDDRIVGIGCCIGVKTPTFQAVEFPKGVSELHVRKLIYDRSIPFLKLNANRAQKACVLINVEEARAALKKNFERPSRFRDGSAIPIELATSRN
jgi:hypothetical protein